MWLWHHDRDAYIRRYVDGIEDPPTRKMILGNHIHSGIQDKRYPLVEEMVKEGFQKPDVYAAQKIVQRIPAPLEAEVFLAVDLDGVRLIGVLDGFDKQGKELDEYKTTDRAKIWTQKRVDLDDQLSFYALLRFLIYHDYWWRIRLWRGYTNTGTVRKFETARGPRDIRYIREKTFGTIEEIKREGFWERRLSRAEIEQKNQRQLIVMDKGRARVKKIPEAE